MQPQVFRGKAFTQQRRREQELNMEMDKEQLGNLLKLLRKRKGLSQKELADRLYISAPMVCKWEKGTFAPTSDMMLRIAQFYDIPVDDLYFPERAIGKIADPSSDHKEGAQEVPSDGIPEQSDINLLPEKAEQSSSVVGKEQPFLDLSFEKTEEVPSRDKLKWTSKSAHWLGVAAVAVIAVIVGYAVRLRKCLTRKEGYCILELFGKNPDSFNIRRDYRGKLYQ